MTNTERLTPYALWRSRLPAQIGTWFARDLTRNALALVDDGRVALRSVEAARIEAAVKDRVAVQTAVEWASGTGPQALRSVCTCGATGVCEHVVATLEIVRTAEDAALPMPSPDPLEPDLSWLPDAEADAVRSRARAVWPVVTLSSAGAIGGALYLDTPRLRGVIRDADAILAMMDQTPADDWDEVDRALLRDDAVQEAFGARASTKALARAFFRLARHPRLRFDDAPGDNRHPAELPPFAIETRGVRLRAQRQGAAFVPVLEAAEDVRVSPAGAFVLDGPPAWLVADRIAYLLDGAFDPRKIIAAAKIAEAAAAQDGAPSMRAIARVAPFLTADERKALGVIDAQRPGMVIRAAWRDGALLARLGFVDLAGGAYVAFNPHGAVTPSDGRFVRFAPEVARAFSRRFLEAGFVPRGADGFALHDADRAADVVRTLWPEWDDAEVRLDDSLATLVGGGTVDVSVHATATESGDWFDLDVSVFVGGGEPLTREELRALLGAKGRYAEVRGKLVDVGDLRSRQNLLSELNDRRRTGLASLVAMRDELHEAFGDVALPEEVERVRERLRNFEGIEQVDAPEALVLPLRDYQRRGLDFLSYLSSFRFGGILADDMGTGKTSQLIAHVAKRKEDEGNSPVLVIAPTSVTHTWENEIRKFAPSLSTLRLQSGSDRAAKYDTIHEFDVIITSYALARLDAQHLERFRFRTLVLDEAQNAKNPSSQIAKVVRGLQADHRLALTGTPVENSLRDLWAIFGFVEPGLLGSETSFRRRFELPIADGDERAASALRSRLEPFLLRRTKEDVAKELPERTEAIIECELTPLQRRLYRGIAEAARRDVLAKLDEDGAESATVHVLAALTRLRQVCAHPGLLVPEYLDDPEASGKFDAFLETVDEVLDGGHKVLVFSAFSSMLKVMRTALDRRNVAYGYLDGSTKDRDRQAEVERFMSDDGPPVFLCSLKAGGVGLTLTAADYVILYDPWWNPAVERQAIDRTHRIGQIRPVTAYRMVTAGSVEEKIRALAERKTALSKTVVKADSAVAKTLTREDLAFLFADPE
ncbi:MAG: SNF2-related protein [Candidatus Eremiobacteraeota bacterium]|nr:SNF2-related protein [Candidatus Eremiobacteraeota bacterium]